MGDEKIERSSLGKFSIFTIIVLFFMFSFSVVSAVDHTINTGASGGISQGIDDTGDGSNITEVNFDFINNTATSDDVVDNLDDNITEVNFDFINNTATSDDVVDNLDDNITEVNSDFTDKNPNTISVANNENPTTSTNNDTEDPDIDTFGIVSLIIVIMFFGFLF